MTVREPMFTGSRKMDLVVDTGGVVFPASVSHALERAVRDALAGEVEAITRLELRLTQLSVGARSWLCSARISFVDGRRAAVEMRGSSPTAAALIAVHALAHPLKRVG